MNEKSQTHDYTNRYWGHDFTVTTIKEQGAEIGMMGWGYGIEEGDYLVLPNEGGETRYRVKEIKYFSDPKDMWSLAAIHAPRPHPETLSL